MSSELDIRVIDCPCCAADDYEYLERLIEADLVVDDRPKDD